MQGSHPPLTIADKELDGDLILAPMAGYSDAPFRRICREQGSAISYTELLSDEGLVHMVERGQPLFAYTEEERPLSVQLLGREPEQLLRAAEAVIAYAHPNFIDINMGCPARRVAGGGRGAALLKELDHIGVIMNALTSSLSVPVTAKIRLGWDAESLVHVEAARVLEDNGAAMVAVHGRTKEQAYSGQADWQAIARVVKAVQIPIVANGDVRSVADIDAIYEVTGCQGVMIGRGAVGNPWIFARVDIENVPLEQRFAMIRRHLLEMVAIDGEQRGIIQFRKHLVRYVRGLHKATEWRNQLLEPVDLEVMLHLLDIIEQACVAGLAGAAEDS